MIDCEFDTLILSLVLIWIFYVFSFNLQLSKENNLLKFNINILNFNKDHIDDCRCCEYRYACFDCRPNSLETNIASKPWYCTYNVNDGVWIDQEIFIDNLDKKWLE